MDTPIERDNSCFCCGRDNERGLHLAIAYPSEGAAETSLEVPEWCAGWKKVTHGGFLSMILDEVMAHACISMARTAVTAEMTTRFVKPVETGSRIRALAKVEESRGRILRTRGWIYDADGNVAAEGSARFLATDRSSRGFPR
jgi:uncharacterized protein (TIGR00369 family)